MIKVFATICRLAAPFDCHDELVTTSELADVSMIACAIGQAQLAEWMNSRPAWRFDRWRCEYGNRGRREQT